MRIVSGATLVGLLLSLLSTFSTSVPAQAMPSQAAPCEPRVLVLAAMPLELYPLLEQATYDPAEQVRVAEKTFYPGVLSDVPVILAMTGIGLVNAQNTVEAAFTHFGCDIGWVVFSGVAGSVYDIGDVAVPVRWTLDEGATWYPSDPAMLARAREIEGDIGLSQVVPTGDAACVCPGVEDIGTAVDVGRRPLVYVGGDGTSSDTYGGKPLPCVPGGGDVFGCEPCLGRAGTAQDAAHFASSAPDYTDPAFIQDFFQAPAATTDAYTAQDQESAAVARSAAAAGVPFLGIRAVSDGEGDPLNLPGFPFQFFAYRQLAGDNAAIATIEWLKRFAPTVAAPSSPSVANPAVASPPGPTLTSQPSSAAGAATLPATGGRADVMALVLGVGLALMGRRWAGVYRAAPDGG